MDAEIVVGWTVAGRAAAAETVADLLAAGEAVEVIRDPVATPDVLVIRARRPARPLD